MSVIVVEYPLYIEHQFDKITEMFLSPVDQSLALAAVEKWMTNNKNPLLSNYVALNCIVTDQRLQIFGFDNEPDGVGLINNYARKPTNNRNSGSPKKYNYFCNDGFGGTVFPESLKFDLDRELVTYTNQAKFSRHEYGEKWLWDKISYYEFMNTLNPNGGFVLRTNSGIRICPPAKEKNRLERLGVKGLSSVEQMKRFFGERCGQYMYYQPYINPLESQEGLPLIHVLYFEIIDSIVRFAGGLIISSPYIRVSLRHDHNVLGVISC